MLSIEEINKLQKENEQLQKDLSCKTQEYEDLKFCTEILSFKYKKCYSILEEIEEIIIPLANKNPVDNCWNLIISCDECTEKKDCKSQSPYFKAKHILDIINKTKGE